METCDRPATAKQRQLSDEPGTIVPLALSPAN